MKILFADALPDAFVDILRARGDECVVRPDLDTDNLPDSVEDADVLVDLYDLSGRRVTRLVDESRRQGHYTDNWDATVDGATVPPGQTSTLTRVIGTH